MAVSDTKMLKTQARLPLGIVVERRALDHPWADHTWRPVAVIPGARPLAPSGEWLLLAEGEDWAQYHAGTLPLDLFAKETEAYKVNLSQSPPRLFVCLRRGEPSAGGHEMVPFLVTASAFEAQDYLDSGEEVVEGVEMPAPVVAFVQDYVDRHHVDHPFHKRKRARAPTGDEAFARRPPAARRGRGNGQDA